MLIGSMLSLVIYIMGWDLSMPIRKEAPEQRVFAYVEDVDRNWQRTEFFLSIKKGVPYDQIERVVRHNDRWRKWTIAKSHFEVVAKYSSSFDYPLIHMAGFPVTPHSPSSFFLAPVIGEKQKVTYSKINGRKAVVETSTLAAGLSYSNFFVFHLAQNGRDWRIEKVESYDVSRVLR